MCELCNNRNEVDLEEEELPKSNEVTYILQAAAQVEQEQNNAMTEDAPQVQTAEGAGRAEDVSDKISVIFCIDVSRSMKKDNRLELCKQAISVQINAMAANNGQRKVGIVTFSSEVEIIGDGSQKPEILKDQNLLHSYS